MLPVLHTSPPPVPYRVMMDRFVRPPGKVYLLYGEEAVFGLSMRIAAQAIHRGASLAVVDGANRFDVHALTRYARERRLNPDAFLQRIYISRGFTCYQMEQAVTRKLPAFLRSIGSDTAIVFGLLDTFYDDQAPLREVRQILQRVLEALRAMKADGVSVLLASRDRRVEPPERNRLFGTLAAGADDVYRLTVDDDHRPHLYLEERFTAKTQRHRGTRGGTDGKEFAGEVIGVASGSTGRLGWDC